MRAVVVLGEDGPAYAIEIGNPGAHLPCPLVHEERGRCGSPLACGHCDDEEPTPIEVLSMNDSFVTTHCPKCKTQVRYALLVES